MSDLEQVLDRLAEMLRRLDPRPDDRKDPPTVASHGEQASTRPPITRTKRRAS